LRIKNIRSVAVMAAVIVGVLGLGAGRADAASPNSSTRYVEDFTVRLRAQGSGVNFECPAIASTWQDSVTAVWPSSVTGARRRFTCTSGNRKITFNYSLKNQYVANRWTYGTHYFNVEWSPDPGTIWSSCVSGSRDSQQQRDASYPIQKWWAESYIGWQGSTTCGGVKVFAQVSVREALSVQ
jgi:hypothetical protein